ncbi:MAG: hypothetical protein K5673_07285 [Lachnospiraceae bacterium]|nr:hypothetical protein [Lachnospiraceae bacterium]
MSGVADRSVLLSVHEILVLLYKKEMAGLILPNDITDVSADELELKKAMGELVTDRYLIPGENDKYSVAPEIRKMLDLMSSATHTYVIYEERARFSPCYLYRLNMDAVCLNMDEHHPGWVRLRAVHMEDKLRELGEYPGARIVSERFKAGQTEADRVIRSAEYPDRNITDLILED